RDWGLVVEVDLDRQQEAGTSGASAKTSGIPTAVVDVLQVFLSNGLSASASADELRRNIGKGAFNIKITGHEEDEGNIVDLGYVVARCDFKGARLPAPTIAGGKEAKGDQGWFSRLLLLAVLGALSSAAITTCSLTSQGVEKQAQGVTSPKPNPTLNPAVVGNLHGESQFPMHDEEGVENLLNHVETPVPDQLGGEEARFPYPASELGLGLG
ncbi:unnamed protein product, partial [Discosporangium mesarthrocarpum]